MATMSSHAVISVKVFFSDESPMQTVSSDGSILTTEHITHSEFDVK
jgi:hypothetical protein